MAITRWLLLVGLVIAGLALEFIEVFVPSFGLITTLGLAAFAFGGYLIYDSYHSITAVVIYGSVVALLLVADLIVGFKLLPRSPLVLRARQDNRRERNPLEDLVGREGVAHTTLRPSGKIRIDGKVLEAESEHGLLEAGAQVLVTGAKTGRLIVRRM